MCLGYSSAYILFFFHRFWGLLFLFQTDAAACFLSACAPILSLQPWSFPDTTPCKSCVCVCVHVATCVTPNDMSKEVPLSIATYCMTCTFIWEKHHVHFWLKLCVCTTPWESACSTVRACAVMLSRSHEENNGWGRRWRAEAPQYCVSSNRCSP